MNRVNRYGRGGVPHFIAALVTGSVLYTGLNWIPLVGPLTVGFIASRISGGGLKRGFNAGIYSGLGGFTILMFSLHHFGILGQLFASSGLSTLAGLLLVWIIFLWNLVGILFCGVGGLLGAMVERTRRVFELGHRFTAELFTGPRPATYVVCPNCGAGNPNTTDHCRTCGIPLGIQ